MNSNEWLLLEDGIRSLIDRLEYSKINLWSLLRRRVFEASSRRTRFPKLRRNVLFMSLSYFAYRAVFSVLCRLLEKKRSPTFSTKILIITTPRHWGKIRDPETGEKKDGEVIYDPIVKELIRRQFEPILIYEFPDLKLLSGLQKFLPRIRDGTISSISYWSIGIWWKAHVWSKYLDRIWRLWSSGNPSLPKELVEELDSCFDCYVRFVIEDVEMSKRLLDDVKPDAILKYSFAWKGFRLATQLVAHTVGIPTVSYDYTFPHLSGIYTEKFDDLPEKICVALKSKYNYLLSIGIKHGRLVLTGSVQSDVVRSASKIFSRENFSKSIGIDAQKKLVLIVTDGTSKSHDLVVTCLDSLKCKDDVEIVVKPHPLETREEYEQIPAKKGKVLSPDSDLYEALYVSDLIVGRFSTAIEEAVMLGRPAISVRFLEREIMPHLQSITLRVHISELESAIKMALYDAQTQKDMMEKVRRYAYDNKVDGHATYRVVDVICKAVQGVEE